MLLNRDKQHLNKHAKWNQLVANFVCCLVLPEQVAYSGFIRVFSLKTAASCCHKKGWCEWWDWIKTVKLRVAKQWAERSWNALWSWQERQSWLIIICGFITTSVTFALHILIWSIIHIKKYNTCSFKFSLLNQHANIYASFLSNSNMLDEQSTSHKSRAEQSCYRLIYAQMTTLYLLLTSNGVLRGQ